MSEKWEVVSGPKRKPKAQSNGQAGGGGNGQLKNASNKGKKPSAKMPTSFALDDISDLISGPDAAVEGLSYAQNLRLLEEKRSQAANKKKPEAASKPAKAAQKQQQPPKPKEKRKDLQSTINQQVSSTELLAFFEELKQSGSVQDVCLSWIKYSADALNSKLNQVTTPDVNQWPNDLSYPILPTDLERAIKTIITETVQARNDLVDVLGVSFASLLATIPTLIQRGDPGWGYLLFLRELCRLDPSLPSRRAKSFTELMESYGNKKEIGICVLWTAAQAGVDSPYVLKIASQNILPYYGFKHYKQFVLAALETITSSANMAVENLIEPTEFDEFFTAAFDPKKKRDLEKIYPRVKGLVLKGLKKPEGGQLFLIFLQKVGDKDFSSVSPYGKEVLDILLGCLDNDSTCVDTWRGNISKFPRESAALLNYLSKVADSVKSSKQLETKLIQSDEFAIASVKNPELLRIAKKLQVGFQRAEASRRRFSWKMGCFLILLTIVGLLWLDVTENGKGSFEKSNTGKLLKQYGLLDQSLVAIKAVSGFAKQTYDYSAVLFRSFYEGIQPVLQSLGEKVQIYIPQATKYLNTAWTYTADSGSFLLQFLQEKVFVGALSPESLRKFTKESLSFIWSNIYSVTDKLYQSIEKYIT